MKKILNLIIFCIASYSCLSQDAKLLPKTIDIHPLYAKNDTFRIEAIPIEIEITADAAADKTINVGWDDINSSTANKPEILNGAISIKKGWKKGSKDTLTIYLKNPGIKDAIKDDEDFYLKIAGQPELITIRLTEKGMYNPNKPFWVEIGANFDFADGLQPNNFFGGVFLNKKEIRPLCENGKFKLGVFTGVYESKTITDSYTENSATRQYFNANSLALIRNDSLATFRDTGKIISNKVVKNISLFFSPQVRLSNHSSDEDGFHFFASLWMELQWQRISSQLDYSNLVRKDTIFVPAATIGQYNGTSISTEKDIKSHYFGIGFPCYFKEGDANAFFNPVIGRSNQPSASDLNNFLLSNNDQLSRHWNWFYVFQFRLNEDHFGFAFTGEVRGLLIKNSPPFVSLALSKKFDLDKFLNFSNGH